MAEALCDALGCLWVRWLTGLMPDVPDGRAFVELAVTRELLTQKQAEAIHREAGRLIPASERNACSQAMWNVLVVPAAERRSRVGAQPTRGSPLADFIDVCGDIDAEDWDHVFLSGIPRLADAAGSCRAVCYYLRDVAERRGNIALSRWFDTRALGVKHCKNVGIRPRGTAGPSHGNRKTEKGRSSKSVDMRLLETLGGAVLVDRDILEEDLLRRNERIAWNEVLRAPTLVVLRRWNSFAPLLGHSQDVGGGFLLWTSKGCVVIDPGFDFVRNLLVAGFPLAAIRAVVVTHAHPDHMAELPHLLTLFHELRALDKRSAWRPTSVFNPQVSWSMIAGDARYQSPRLALNLTAFECVGRMLPLDKTATHAVTILSAGVQGTLVPGVQFRCLPARHDDVGGTGQGVGVVFVDEDTRRAVLYTSDTGVDASLMRDYAEVCRQMGVTRPLLLCNLGGVSESELLASEIVNRTPDGAGSQELPGSVLYRQHLGVLGVQMIAETVKPRAVLLSEMGPEWGSRRATLVKEMGTLLGVPCIVADLGLSVEAFGDSAYGINEDLQTSLHSLSSIRSVYGPNTIYHSHGVQKRRIARISCRAEGWTRNLPQASA